MKLFDNLRKRIVQKLIRPEDGYTFTGFSRDEPIRCYYHKSKNMYIVSMYDDDGNYYFKPTLTGWAPYYMNNEEPDEVNFKTWLHGVLENIYNEYSERLNNISLKELKSIQNYRKENGEKVMITKKSFCDIMGALDSYWTNLRALEDILNVYFERNMMTDILDKVVDALEEELEPQFYDPELDFDINEDPMIMRWLTGLESDRTVDGQLLSSAEELYDYLVCKREKTLKKFENTP